MKEFTTRDFYEDKRDREEGVCEANVIDQQVVYFPEAEPVDVTKTMIRVHYRNANGRLVSVKNYSFTDYIDMIRMDLFRCVTDIEDVFYRHNKGKAKDQWFLEDQQDFLKLKHKLLDKAGELERIPSAIVKPSDGVNVANFLATLDA